MDSRKIFIDGDGCSLLSRELAERLCNRGIQVVLVANRQIPTTNALTVFVKSECVENATDTYIIDHVQTQDLVITKDLALAKTLLELTDGNVVVISDFGERYTLDIIDARITRSIHAKERRAFSLVLDSKVDTANGTKIAWGDRSKTKAHRKIKDRIKGNNKLASILESWRMHHINKK